MSVNSEGGAYTSGILDVKRMNSSQILSCDQTRLVSRNLGSHANV